MIKKLSLALAICAISLLTLSGTVHADSNSLIGMITGGDIYVKSGSNTDPWSVRLTTGASATHLQMYGDRVAYIDASGNLWLKQGLTSYWYEQTSNVSSYALTETGLLVLKTDGSVWFKGGQSPTAMFDTNEIASSATQVDLSPTQLVVVESSGNLLGKPLLYNGDAYVNGADGPWELIAQNATSAAVSDTMLVYIDNSGNVYGKNGAMNTAWWNNHGIIDDRTIAVGISGTMYCAEYNNLFSTSSLSCKPFGFSDYPVDVFGNTVNSFALAPGRVVVKGNDGDGGTYLRALDFSEVTSSPSGYSLNTSGWNILSTTGTEITTNQE